MRFEGVAAYLNIYQHCARLRKNTFPARPLERRLLNLLRILLKSRGREFLRVDFYDVGGRAMFGEFCLPTFVLAHPARNPVRLTARRSAAARMAGKLTGRALGVVDETAIVWRPRASPA